MTKEEIDRIKQTINDLTIKIEDKFDELSKSAGRTFEEKKEYAKEKVSEKPLAYLAKAFFGGVIVGYVIGKGKCYCRER